jgi:hypothetical protein
MLRPVRLAYHPRKERYMSLSTIAQTALAPDGSQVTMSCRTARVQPDWFWHMRLTSKTVAIGVSVTGTDYFDHTVRVRGLRPTDQITYGGRPFVLGVDTDTRSWMAAWNGVHHGLVFGGAAPAPRIGALVTVLESLEVTDHPEGMTLSAIPGSGVVMWGLSGVKFSDSGMITMYPRTDAHALLPAQAGLRVEHGEVWSKSLETGGSSRGRKFLHAGDTAVCTIEDDLGRDPTVTADGQAELIASLRVSWTR